MENNEFLASAVQAMIDTIKEKFDITLTSDKPADLSSFDASYFAFKIEEDQIINPEYVQVISQRSTVALYQKLENASGKTGNIFEAEVLKNGNGDLCFKAVITLAKEEN